ncbi:MAG: hypothetical protein IJY47_07745 [Clostridia bacterium]|nr:hypothetical protein [Clostridia bacterium]
MKKFLALFLCLMLLATSFVMVSCDSEDDEGTKAEETTESATPATLNGKTPKEVYSQASATMNANPNVTMTMTTTATMVSQSTEAKTTQSSTVKMDNQKMYVAINMDDYNMETWYADGTMYMKMDDEKYKAAMSLDEFEDTYGSSMAEDTLLSLTDDLFENKTFLKDETTGDYILEFSLTAAQIGELMEAMQMDSQNATINGDVNYRVAFNKDAQMTGMKISFDMTMDNYTMNLSMDATFQDYGTTTVTLPADAATYKEMSLSVPV